jgi:hypothetical protein
MSTSAAQEMAHKAAVALAEAEKQRALAAAKQAYSGLAIDWAVYDVAVRAADAAYCRAVIVSSVAQGLGGGPRQTLHWLNGTDS